MDDGTERPRRRQQPDPSKYPKLSREQAGHLRHFHNLLPRPDNDWRLMGSQEPLQEFPDAYRYQLATTARSGSPGPTPSPGRTSCTSGHLLMVVSLYAMLFDDDGFEAPGALTFVWDPLFFGMGPETFSYSAQALQDAILGGNGEQRLGRFPVSTFSNSRPGGGGGQRRAWTAAWKEKGLVGPDGLFPDLWMVRQDVTLPASDPAWTAWGSAFMNAWNGAFVRSHFDEQSLGHVASTGGEVRSNQPPVAAEFGRLVKERGASATSRETLETARRNPTFGYVSQWLSELGKDAALDGLLDCTTPRNDRRFEGELLWARMDPFSGNAAIGYARLSVEDGQRIIWERPRTAEAVASRPYVDGVTLDDGVDFPRGDWHPASGLLALTVRAWDGDVGAIRPVVKGLGPGPWDFLVGGGLASSRVLSAGEDIALELQVGGADLDIVVVKRV
ncbi:hypothetical protein LX32DRAFT_667422 [Colletotrichum zoysiae]|uniref:Linalool dehydratase/isomerase domain-containing protein n=1 Tax=Colletotrichum zoysiae TaxID=1216348 RepID=A0AAD9H8G4_9PEZI|nr:hypothetical protein LX32DRAFT_667422 [Colletotrichum zoysiae]